MGGYSFTLLTVVLGLSTTAFAQVLVDPNGLTGSRSTPQSSGVFAANGWTETNGGFTISWEILFDPNVAHWTYSYTITDKDGTPIEPEISHLLLEISPFISPDNVGDHIFNSTVPITGPMTWTADPNSPNTTNPGANNGNPNLPDDIYGIKLDESLGTYTFQSSQPPMWGDFYSKDGKQGGIVATAWNVGFGTDPNTSTMDFTAWVPVPDTLAPPGVCGDGMVNQPGEECDGPDDVACPGECRGDCSCPPCGNGVIDPGETCDPPGSLPSPCVSPCRSDCTCCGDGIIDRNPDPNQDEECDPPQLEICDNNVDDDWDGKKDCEDIEQRVGSLSCSGVSTGPSGVAFFGSISVGNATQRE